MPDTSDTPAFLAYWVKFVVTKPWTVVAVMLFLSVIGAVLASHIQIKSHFLHLLPPQCDAVEDHKEIDQRLGNMGTLVIHVSGPTTVDLPHMQKLADVLAQRIEAFPSSEIRYVEHRVTEAISFFEKSGSLFVSESDLQDIKNRLQTRITEKKQSANPFFISIGNSAPNNRHDDSRFLGGYEKKFGNYLRLSIKFAAG